MYLSNISIYTLLFITVYQSCYLLSNGQQFSVPPFKKEPGKCIMYGKCATRTGNKAQNCFYNGPAKVLKDTEALDILIELCPNLYTGPNTTTCCDLFQLTTMQDSIKVPFQMLSRCPSCFDNFVAQFCEMTCSPNQSLFTAPVMVLNGNQTGFVAPTDATYVTELAYNMTAKYANKMFDSCKNVTSPATNAPALKILCPYQDCTAKQWISYMNSFGNGYAPFQIDVAFTNTSDWSMDHKTVGCNESLNGKGACSCNDCPSSCSGPPPKPPAPKTPWLLFGKDAYFVIMGIIFAATTLVFVLVLLLKWCFTQRPKHSILNDGEHVNTTLNAADDDLGVKSVDSEDSRCFESFGVRLEHIMQQVFEKWGTFCATYPVAIILCGIVFVAVCTAGLKFMTITTDPVELWSAPQSDARIQKEYFDSHFGPFFRTEQLIISAPNVTGFMYEIYSDDTTAPPNFKHFGPIFNKDVMIEILNLQLEIENITAEDKLNKTITLTDICFSPLSPYNHNCTIMSPLNYFQNNIRTLNKSVTDFMDNPIIDYRDHLIACVNGPAALDDATRLHESCLGTYGGPIFPWVALGGYDEDNYLNATAAVITFSVNNYYNDTEKLDKALAWEKKYLEFMKDYQKRTNRNLTVAFSAERSIEDEIERESSADIMTILASYLIMFAYVAIALGKFASWERIFIECKLTVGLCGVLIVLCSVGVSLGVFSYAGVPLTLIIAEVIPFLVLAVGVDNIFILVQHYQRDERHHKESHAEHIGRILSEVAPSMFMSSVSESLAFFLGGLSTMPAVRTFSLFAGMAVFVDFLLQMTVFVAILSLDTKREQAKRYDCCCFVQNLKASEGESEGLLHSLMRNYISPVVLSTFIRPLMVIVFFGMACFSGAVLHKVEIGLDQKLSMPSDSYVLDYFDGMNNYLSVGAPVYFIVPDGYDYSNNETWNSLCSGTGCSEHSLTQQISNAALIPHYSRIAAEASSWIDDYFSWLIPQSMCCRHYNDDKNAFCNATEPRTNCTTCRSAVDSANHPRPSSEQFMEFMPWFLNDVPEVDCAKGGHAAYETAVKLKDNQTNIGATYFMTYHTIARNSTDFIECYKHALDITKNMTVALNNSVEVFPYSVFYVYYEQYLTIVHDTIFNLGISMAAIFCIVFVLLGLDLRSALIIVGTIALIILDMFGVMFLWSIPLNAVSLVNLVMAVGISVEFCSHITRAFALSQRPTKLLRAKEALAEMGSSVLSGITLTKFVGIAILGFSKSQIFFVFYFKMYLSIVILGALHGLILLPIILSAVGPPRRKRANTRTHSRLVEDDTGSHSNDYDVIDSQPNSSLMQ